MNAITPDQFREQIVAPVKSACRCSVPGFQKLISFNFEDYGISPTLLWDSEILIHEVIRNGFEPIDESIQRQGEFARRYRCPVCARVCVEKYAEFSINMYRSYVLFQDDLRSKSATFILGLRGFDSNDFQRIHDFTKTEDMKSYFTSITQTNSEQVDAGNRAKPGA